MSRMTATRWVSCPSGPATGTTCHSAHTRAPSLRRLGTSSRTGSLPPSAARTAASAATAASSSGSGVGGYWQAEPSAWQNTLGLSPRASSAEYPVICSKARLA